MDYVKTNGTPVPVIDVRHEVDLENEADYVLNDLFAGFVRRVMDFAKEGKATV
jgi:hypothetical protein